MGTHENSHDVLKVSGYGIKISREDLGRTLDYLESRTDIDSDRVAFFGFSLGTIVGSYILAYEDRFKAAIFESGGFTSLTEDAEDNAVSFVPRIRMPTLMLNGKHDFGFRYEEQVAPLFRLLGVPDSLKRHTLWEGGHAVPRLLMIRETLDWFDRYLGPVDR